MTAGRIDRLQIWLPPRHAKSETASHWFPTWLIGNFPQTRVILCSHGADFAASWGRKVRDSLNFAIAEGVFNTKICADSSASDRWETIDGGGMVTAGAGGSITGRGANFLILDDLIKNSEQASSFTHQEKVWDWYTGTAYTRLEPGGKIVVMNTRWDLRDISGRMLSPDYSDETEIDKWEVIRIPAIAGLDDPLGRSVGEALWPERYDIDALDAIRRQIGSYWFGAQYQQEPKAKKEALVYPEFDVDKHVKEPPADTQFTGTAYGMDFGWTNLGVVLVCKMDANENIWVLDEIAESKRDIATWWGPKLKKLYEEYGRGNVWCDPSQPSNITSLRKNRIFAERANNSVIPGITIVASHFEDNKLFISPKCANLIHELQAYSWKKRADGIVPDEVEKTNDHGADSLRYMLLGITRRSR